MLEVLGTLIGNVLSLPGILGFALGMMTRSIPLAAVLGAIVGFGEAMVFADFSLTNIDPLEISLSVLVGVVFALLGCLTRKKGATV